MAAYTTGFIMASVTCGLTAEDRYQLLENGNAFTFYECWKSCQCGKRLSDIPDVWNSAIAAVMKTELYRCMQSIAILPTFHHSAFSRCWWDDRKDIRPVRNISHQPSPKVLWEPRPLVKRSGNRSLKQMLEVLVLVVALLWLLVPW